MGDEKQKRRKQKTDLSLVFAIHCSLIHKARKTVQTGGGKINKELIGELNGCKKKKKKKRKTHYHHHHHLLLFFLILIHSPILWSLSCGSRT